MCCNHIVYVKIIYNKPYEFMRLTGTLDLSWNLSEVKPPGLPTLKCQHFTHFNFCDFFVILSIIKPIFKYWRERSFVLSNKMMGVCSIHCARQYIDPM